MKEGAKQRKLFTNSAAALRVARRRYARLLITEIEHLDMNTLFYLSKRMQERGFYSLKTCPKDVLSSLMTYLFKNDLEYQENTHPFHWSFKSWILYRGLSFPYGYHFPRAA